MANINSLSVLIAAHGGEKTEFLDLSIRSIWCNQSFKPNQIVLVKDGPLGYELEDVIDKWKERLGDVLTIVAIEHNAGLGYALNVGLKYCSHNFVARMDADDLAVSDRFSKQLEFLAEHPEIDIVGSFVKEMSYSGDLLGIRKVPVTHDEIVSCLWASPVVHPSIMMRRSQVLAAGNYDPKYRRRQDYELWFRCVAKGLRFHNLAQPLLYYRFGEHTHKKQSPKLALEQALIGYRGASKLGMPLYQRCACFVPFIRSLLPAQAQHLVYKLLKPFDPRQK